MAGNLLSQWLAGVESSPDVLRRYADIFEMARRDTADGPLRKPIDISITAAKCFRIVADLKDLQAVLTDTDPNVGRLLELTGPSVNEFIDAKYLAR